MTREEYKILHNVVNTLISTIKTKITAADAMAKEAEEKRAEYEKTMKEEYSRGRHYREVVNIMEETLQSYYTAITEEEKKYLNTTNVANPNVNVTAYNNAGNINRPNEEVRVDGNQT